MYRALNHRVHFSKYSLKHSNWINGISGEVTSSNFKKLSLLSNALTMNLFPCASLHTIS